MTETTGRRERLLNLVREERARQIETYGTNDTNPLGFGLNRAWLAPYTTDTASEIEAKFRADYGAYEAENGEPTWMHLIREEVSELFDSTSVDEAVGEAIQVAALCVSLAEHLLNGEGVLE